MPVESEMERCANCAVPVERDLLGAEVEQLTAGLVATCAERDKALAEADRLRSENESLLELLRDYRYYLNAARLRRVLEYIQCCIDEGMDAGSAKPDQRVFLIMAHRIEMFEFEHPDD